MYYYQLTWVVWKVWRESQRQKKGLERITATKKRARLISHRVDILEGVFELPVVRGVHELALPQQVRGLRKQQAPHGAHEKNK